MQQFHLIKIAKNYGRHTDVYVDFENQILKHTGWNSIKAPNKYLQYFYYTFILPKLKSRKFNFNRSFFKSKKYLFAIMSGTEYGKIFLQYSFKAKLKVLYMFDPWPTVNQINENALRSYKINIAFISARQAVKHFNSLNIPEFIAYWIPEGVRSESYKFYDYNKKSIDLLQYGRQWIWLHNEIYTFCNENNIIYEFPNNEDFNKAQFNTRNLLVDALAKTKIVVCVPRNITHFEQIGNQSTLTTRYFECMSSKCLILGIAPQELIELFGYNPVIEIDTGNPHKQLLSLIKDYDSYIPLIEKNYQTVIQNHQWKNRIFDMVKILSNSNML